MPDKQEAPGAGPASRQWHSKQFHRCVLLTKLFIGPLRPNTWLFSAEEMHPIFSSAWRGPCVTGYRRCFACSTPLI